MKYTFTSHAVAVAVATIVEAKHRCHYRTHNSPLPLSIAIVAINHSPRRQSPQRHSTTPTAGNYSCRCQPEVLHKSPPPPFFAFVAINFRRHCHPQPPPSTTATVDVSHQQCRAQPPPPSQSIAAATVNDRHRCQFASSFSITVATVNHNRHGKLLPPSTIATAVENTSQSLLSSRSPLSAAVNKYLTESRFSLLPIYSSPPSMRINFNDSLHCDRQLLSKQIAVKDYMDHFLCPH